jgi:hypothetical protein
MDNTSGDGNAAQGEGALQHNTTGMRNIAVGNSAMTTNTTGSYNTALGWQAGEKLTTGHDNIDIANFGVAGDSQAMRIGTRGSAGVEGSGVTATYIAGIFGVSVTSGSTVMINAEGQLGTVVSSERYKTAIAPMGSDTARLGQLRPVSFRLKSDATGTRQYGLIAEEVAKVYPELVVRDEQGRINGVRYDELAPMLLNETQQQQRTIAVQSETIATQGVQIRTMQERLTALEGLNQATQAALRQLQAKGEFVAQR